MTVPASLDQYAEYEHIEKILNDAISMESIQYMDNLDEPVLEEKSEKHRRYQTEDYRPTAHEYRANNFGLQM